VRNKPYQNKSWLIRQYVDNGLSCKEIAYLCDVHPTTIQKHLQKHRILRLKAKQGKKMPKHIEKMFTECSYIISL